MLGWSRAGCGAGLSQWSPKILPAPSCYVFTMVSWDVGSWICVGYELDTSVLSTNRRKLPFYINEIYIKQLDYSNVLSLCFPHLLPQEGAVQSP